MKKFVYYFQITIFTFISFITMDITAQNNKNLNTDKIDINSLINTVSYFASPKLEGRMAASKGYFLAAEFSANKFKKYGLKPINNDSYYQYFNVEYNEIKEPILFKVIDSEKEYKLGRDFIFRGFSGGGNVTGEVVFCGYGISQPEIGYDDYQNIDVKNKIVMVFKYHPRWSNEKGKFVNSNPREKAAIAFNHGAKAILFVSFPNDKEPQKPIGSVISGSGEQNINFPELHIDLSVAGDLFNGLGISLNEIQTKIDSTKSPYSINLNKKVNILVKTEYSKEKETVNIIGYIPGINDKLKDEYVILGAHLDHVGKQGDTLYFPGANDNASGSAALLEIAKAFSLSDIKPKRTIVFILFSSEESGLHGAEFYVNNPIFPLEKTVAMLNMDCIAYGDSIQLGNGKSSPVLWTLAKNIDKQNDNFTVNHTWSGGGADATPFHKKGIPTLYFVTTNSYDHLHYMTDKPETLNRNLFHKITKLVYLTMFNLSEGNYLKEIVK
ncbi:MAG TPA: M20/M25/M40 family metallo-hydrolase [Melioribacteraceae bacterium]|nr:M20/M25/M40 family metallo-hydrolase [Melioribacteraceae bacterium]